MPQPTYSPLATVTLGSSASSVTFSSIPATYRDLILVARFTTAASGSTFDVRLNGDSSSTYSHVGMNGRSNGANSFSFTATGKFELLGNSFGTSPAQCIFQLMDYSATDKHKTGLSRAQSEENGTAMNLTNAYAVRYPSTSAITSLSCHSFAGSVSFASGSTFALYGVIA
jgi:hypothetical protein